MTYIVGANPVNRTGRRNVLACSTLSQRTGADERLWYNPNPNPYLVDVVVHQLAIFRTASSTIDPHANHSVIFLLQCTAFVLTVAMAFTASGIVREVHEGACCALFVLCGVLALGCWRRQLYGEIGQSRPVVTVLDVNNMQRRGTQRFKVDSRWKIPPGATWTCIGGKHRRNV